MTSEQWSSGNNGWSFWASIGIAKDSVTFCLYLLYYCLDWEKNWENTPFKLFKDEFLAFVFSLENATEGLEENKVANVLCVPLYSALLSVGNPRIDYLRCIATSDIWANNLCMLSTDKRSHWNRIQKWNIQFLRAVVLKIL